MPTTLTQDALVVDRTWSAQELAHYEDLIARIGGPSGYYHRYVIRDHANQTLTTPGPHPCMQVQGLALETLVAREKTPEGFERQGRGIVICWKSLARRRPDYFDPTGPGAIGPFMSFQFSSALNTRLNSPWFCQR